ncbi:DUF2993 domain-containing protein [Allocoleopsis sp.]|uniref:LmeA family phospholipid-binding protein n=1 Tax=Allocoleopsis sp. TaxID=3088169 RepID=UPI002FCF03F3
MKKTFFSKPYLFGGAMDVETPDTVKSQRSRIISKVLSPAVQLWLRSQVEQVETLKFKIIGADRQILSGHIPTVSVTASRVVYQGLHLSQIELEGTGIRVNLGQVIKGKPLRLLKPVPVAGQLLLFTSDLLASLQAPLLSTAVTEFLITLLNSNGISHSLDPLQEQQISWQHIDIEEGQLTLLGTLTDATLQITPIVIRAGLHLATPQVLKLNPLQIQISQTLPPLVLDGFQVDLGSEVNLEELALTSGQMLCRGRLTVLP